MSDPQPATGFINGVGTGLLFLIGGAIAVVIYLALIRMSVEPALTPPGHLSA